MVSYLQTLKKLQTPQNIKQVTDNNISYQHNLKKNRSAGFLTPKLALHKAPIGARHNDGRP